jgi:ABC-2 type transport system permease protein
MDGLMRLPIVWAVIVREWRELVRNRLLLFSVLLPPIILAVLPIVLVKVAGDTPHIPAGAVAQIVASHPQWSDMTPNQVALAFALQQFLVTYLLLPGYIPLAIASYSIVGEKQSRSLEAVLATPIRTTELLSGKAIAAIVPAILAAWISYLAVLDLSIALLGSRLTAVLSEPAWLGAVFALGPAVGLVSVTAGLLVSSRVNDPRAAQQIGAVILLPIIGVMVIQTAGNFLLDASAYLVAALATTIVAAIGLRVGVVVFGRETILTRWK